MSEYVTIARPYARAAFELASEAGKIPEWSQLLTVLADILANDAMESLINNPEISRQQIMHGILDSFEGRLDEQQTHFVQLLVNTRRLLAASEIAVLFQTYQADAEQTIQAEVISARPLDAQQIENFQQVLAHSTGKKVQISTRVDETLIGGALVRAGDRVIDGSLKNRLNSLSTALA